MLSLRREGNIILEDLVSKNYKNLNENDLHIWQYISSNKESCLKMSIEQLAEKCNVSRTTVLRFTKKVSLQGYSELKFYLKHDLIQRQDISYEKITSLCNDYINSIFNFNNWNLERGFEILYKAKRIFVYGSSPLEESAVKELKQYFLKLGILVYSIGYMVSAAQMEALFAEADENDAVIIISLVGESPKAIELINGLKGKGCRVISITSMRDNRIARAADYSLHYAASLQNIEISGHKFESVGMLFFVVEIFSLKFAVYLNEKL
jgi:RpiR family glv operon transcriptional regulator